MWSKLACLALVAALAACGNTSPEQSGERRGPAPGDGKGPPSGAKPTVPDGQATLTGKVLETMDSGGYTYIRMDPGGRERWVAVTQATVKVGDTVTLVNGIEMKTFTSKTLNRTFERILFGQLGSAPASAPAGAGTLPPGHPPIPAAGAAGADAKAPQHPPVAPPARIGDLKVPKATGPAGHTVAGVFADSAKLKDKPVVVNGVVVKINTGIMNKNWLHLQDGTGAADKKDNDLVVTTLDTVKVGDKVKISGTVRKDKDFGFGYKYATIVEEAKTEPLK